MSKDCLTCKWAAWKKEDDRGYRDGECKWEPSGPIPKTWSLTRNNWIMSVPPRACGPQQVEGFARAVGSWRLDDCPAWEPKEGQAQ